MKILCISHKFGLDGASLMLTNTTLYWSTQLGWEIHALIPPNSSDEILKSVTDAGMTPIFTAKYTDLYDFTLINSLLNIEYANQLHPKIPKILWAHEGEQLLSTVPRFPSAWQNLFKKMALVIFQTNWAKDTIFRSFIYELPEERVAVIPNGIPPYNLNQEESRHQQNDKLLTITNIGRLCDAKRQVDLIEASIALAKNYPIRCQIIGSSEDLDLKKVAQLNLLFNNNREVINYLGELPRNQALEICAKSDIFCFPSPNESYALSPLEAASLSVPVILADIPCYKDVGWRDQENCLMFPPRNSKALYETIEKLILDKEIRQKIAKGGYKLAGAHSFDIFLKIMTASVINIIK